MFEQSFIFGYIASKEACRRYCYYDAKGCFDRIVHTVAILVLMSFGLCPEHARLAFEILQLAEHCIKTGFGVSDHVYGTEEDE